MCIMTIVILTMKTLLNYKEVLMTKEAKHLEGLTLQELNCKEALTLDYKREILAELESLNKTLDLIQQIKKGN